ncbi:helix-turn-helix transcriptional regulator [Mordavella massiliensis]|uniref:Helix-turn-helix transcriptional regulator n=1 Tax=Mordavella massiliensis TaxID=1871024 RepID=A0A938XCC5_9CLOT|nr:helix-turn-helix transcriptional regulator [Mordavella massiliensis]MBM6948447.1 helix-turn-helix transcriptional regulator [Mordavella massiliensis]
MGNDENEGNISSLGERLATLRKKYGYSQQEIADRLAVTRQTISNWECGQGAPALDKAAELAVIFEVSLDELAGLAGERKELGSDLHILKKLEGRRCQLEFAEENAMDAVMDGLLDNANVRILEVGDRWVTIEYERTKEDAMFQKETVVWKVERAMIIGASFAEEKES